MVIAIIIYVAASGSTVCNISKNPIPVLLIAGFIALIGF